MRSQASAARSTLFDELEQGDYIHRMRRMGDSIGQQMARVERKEDEHLLLEDAVTGSLAIITMEELIADRWEKVHRV